MGKLGLAAGRPSESRKRQALEAVTDNGEKEMRVNFKLSADEHMRLKVFAAKSKRTVQDIVHELVIKGIPGPQ